MLSKAFNLIAALRAYPYRQTAKRLILETPIEIAIGAVALGGVCGISSFNHESAKQGQIPLAFSEINQTILYVERIGGKTVPPLTRYYSSVNDALMQVFEANNISYNSWGPAHEHFARELEYKTDRAFRIHTQITEYAARMPELARKARESIAPMTEAARDLQPAIAALDKAWDADHDDVYRTEYYTEEECSGSGESRSCTMVTKSRQVYDHTVHTYTYDRAAGVRAAALLQDFMRKHPDLDIKQPLILAWQTNAENEWAMRESRRRLPDYKELTQADYMRLTNTWASGSTYVTLTPGIWDAHGKLKTITPKWAAAAPAAHSDSYTTYSSSDAGPQSFQTAEAALSYAVHISKDINRIDSGMAAAQTGIPALHKKILEYIAVSLDRKPGDPDKLKSEIMRDARAIYSANYAGGFDTQPAKWGMVVLWSVLGLLGGAGLGFGADRLIDRFYGSRGQQRPRPSWQQHMTTPRYTRRF